MIAKSQKSQETPKALIDKLWALQEVYDEVYNEAHNEVCDKAHDDTHQDSTNATNPESNI